MAYNINKIFESGLGKGIAQYNLLDALKTDLDTALSEWATFLCGGTEGERELLAAVSNYYLECVGTINAMMSDIISRLRVYMLTEILSDLNVPENNLTQVLDALTDAMEEAGHTVLANTVSASTPVEDPDNTGGKVAGEMSAVGTTQYIHDDCDFSAVCYDNGTQDAELWRIRNNLESNLGTATTGVLFENEKYGISFTISAGNLPWEIGDRITFYTSIDMKKLWQTFFVTQWHTALPDGLEDVLEVWAT